MSHAKIGYNNCLLTMFVNKLYFVCTKVIIVSSAKIGYNNCLLTVFVSKLYFVWTMIIVSDFRTIHNNRLLTLTLTVTCWARLNMNIAVRPHLFICWITLPAKIGI